jgi:hypothetical protein
MPDPPAVGGVDTPRRVVRDSRDDLDVGNLGEHLGQACRVGRTARWFRRVIEPNDEHSDMAASTRPCSFADFSHAVILTGA